MYKRYSGIICLLLNYVTCGIYSLFMWHGMTKNLNDMADKVGEKKIMGFIPQFLLGCVTCGIFSIIWIYQFFSLMTRLNEKKSAGVSPKNAFVKLLISFIPIYSFIWMADSHNKLADVYEK